MSLAPLFAAPLHIQIHAFGAIAAFVLGVVQIAGPKGTSAHKIIGSLWVALMAAVVLSSAFIANNIGPSDPLFNRFGLIHLLTVLGAYALTQGVVLIRKGRPTLKHHAKPFIGFFIGGLIIAGALALAPGRTMHAVVFGG